MKLEIHTDIYKSPIGEMVIGSYDGRICMCHWLHSSSNITAYLHRHLGAEYNFRTSEINKIAISQLNEYFNKERTKFEFPLMINGTEFQKNILIETTKIPYGKHLSYKELATIVNSPLAVRATGSALKNNPIAIIIPCHRVLSSTNKLTGYAGGILNKEYLLKLEGNPLNIISK